MKILDPRFNYVPAAATDVAATWKRFGFSSRANEARREAWRARFPVAALPRKARTALLVLCATALAACVELSPRSSEPLPGWRDAVASPVFVSGGEVRGDAPTPELAYSREIDDESRDCLSMHAIGQRTAASFGSSLRGRSDACQGAMPGGR